MPITNIDLSITEKIQSLGEWLLPYMKFFTYIGEPTLYIIVVFFITWFYHYEIGVRLGLVLSFSGMIQSVGKLIVRQPRPYVVSDKIIQRVKELGYGFPSGHALVGATFYTYIMRQWKNCMTWLFGITLIILIGMSRVYLGAHTFFQVISGWILGALIVFGFFYFERRFGKAYQTLKLSWKIFLALSVLIVLIVFTLPSSFIIGHMSFEEFLWKGELGLPAGLFAGFAIGAILFFNKKINICLKTVWWKNLIKALILILTVIFFMFMLGIAENVLNKTMASLLIFFLSFLLGFWGIYLAPVLFLKVGLMKKE